MRFILKKWFFYLTVGFLTYRTLLLCKKHRNPWNNSFRRLSIFSEQNFTSRIKHVLWKTRSKIHIKYTYYSPPHVRPRTSTTFRGSQVLCKHYKWRYLRLFCQFKAEFFSTSWNSLFRSGKQMYMSQMKPSAVDFSLPLLPISYVLLSTEA